MDTIDRNFLYFCNSFQTFYLILKRTNLFRFMVSALYKQFFPILCRCESSIMSQMSRASMSFVQADTCYCGDHCRIKTSRTTKNSGCLFWDCKISQVRLFAIFLNWNK